MKTFLTLDTGIELKLSNEELKFSLLKESVEVVDHNNETITFNFMITENDNLLAYIKNISVDSKTGKCLTSFEAMKETNFQYPSNLSHRFEDSFTGYYFSHVLNKNEVEQYLDSSEYPSKHLNAIEAIGKQVEETIYNQAVMLAYKSLEL